MTEFDNPTNLQTITDLQKSQEALQSPVIELLAEWEKPLRFSHWEDNGPLGYGRYSTVKQGIFWLPSFVGPFSIYRKPKKQPKPKHTCPECGALHARKG